MNKHGYQVPSIVDDLWSQRLTLYDLWSQRLTLYDLWSQRLTLYDLLF